jgi:diguanylate cyclase
MPHQGAPSRRRTVGGSRPLTSDTATCGVLGFVKCRGRKWKPEAIHTLKTVASLFAQFRARITAEERLRHLAEHDDLTGLRNRRALLAHLSDRLAVRQPGPVAVLYIDLDRLKVARSPDDRRPDDQPDREHRRRGGHAGSRRGHRSAPPR